MVTNNSIAKRAKVSIEALETLKDDDPIWDSFAFYVGHLCVNILMICSPEVIIIGGGIVSGRKSLMPKIRKQFKIILNEYVRH